LCTQLTAIALLIMLVGADRCSDRNTCMPRPCSACIHAPMCCSMNFTQPGPHAAYAFAFFAFSRFCAICRTVLALLR
jgi:hypothetical protein